MIIRKLFLLNNLHLKAITYSVVREAIPIRVQRTCTLSILSVFNIRIKALLYSNIESAKQSGIFRSSLQTCYSIKRITIIFTLQGRKLQGLAEVPIHKWETCSRLDPPLHEQESTCRVNQTVCYNESRSYIIVLWELSCRYDVNSISGSMVVAVVTVIYALAMHNVVHIDKVLHTFG